MKYYIVGGAVRDMLLNLEPNDIDYVVVGSSPEEMDAKGYKCVGVDFPVYLDEYGNEIALARVERSVGSSYTEFDCRTRGVTLEQDLYRRDLTINAMAYSDNMTLIDPYGGQADVENKVLRHVSNAFIEDPVRILRIAEFLSRFGPEWSVAPETQKLIGHMVCKGMLTHLTPERVWKVTEKALGNKYPNTYFRALEGFCIFPELEVLRQVPQRADHHPEGDVLTHTEMVVDRLVGMPRTAVFAALCHDMGKYEAYERYGNAHGHEELGLSSINEFCDKLRIPNKYRKLALRVCKYHTEIHGVLGQGTNGPTTPAKILKILEGTRAQQNVLEFMQILDVCKADAKGRGKTPKEIAEFAKAPYKQANYLLHCLGALQKVDTKKVAEESRARGNTGSGIGYDIRIAKINAIRGAIYELSSARIK